MLIRKTVYYILVVFLCSFILSCKENKPAPPIDEDIIVHVTELAFNDDLVNMKVGEQIQLNYSFKPADAFKEEIIWISLDPSIAEVSKGVVTAYKAGEVDIIMKTFRNECEAKCKVRISDSLAYPEMISITPSRTMMMIGDELDLSVDVKAKSPIVAKVPLSKWNLRWTSSNPEIVSVTEEGHLKAMSDGTALISVFCSPTIITDLGPRVLSDEGIKAVCEVSVNKPDPNYTFKTELRKGDLFSITYRGTLYTAEGAEILSKDDCTTVLKLESSSVKLWGEFSSLELDNLILSELNIVSAPSLREFRCNNNTLNELSVVSAPRLRKLECNNNSLKKLSVESAPNLEELRCDNNILSRLLIESVASLQKLSCDNNLLEYGGGNEVCT